MLNNKYILINPHKPSTDFSKEKVEGNLDLPLSTLFEKCSDSQGGKRAWEQPKRGFDEDDPQPIKFLKKELSHINQKLTPEAVNFSIETAANLELNRPASASDKFLPDVGIQKDITRRMNDEDGKIEDWYNKLALISIDDQKKQLEDNSNHGLSIAKYNYLKNPKIRLKKLNSSSIKNQLTQSKLTKLRDFYQVKHKIEIIINGETDLSKLMKLNQLKSKISQYEELTKLAALVDANNNNLELLDHSYYILAEKCFVRVCCRHSQEYIFKGIIQGALKRDISWNDRTYSFDTWEQAVNGTVFTEEEKCSIGKAIANSEELKTSLIERLNKEIEFLKDYIDYSDYMGLDKANCLQEINSLILGNYNRKAYIFTNATSTIDSFLFYEFKKNYKGRCPYDTNHFETLILDGNDIINPIPFDVESNRLITEDDIKNLYTSKVDEFAKLILEVSCYNRRRFLPRATIRECATLGMLYVKEYLKNDAYQLKNFTWKLTYKDKYNNQQNFLCPSPQVLRYSQSRSYNQIIKHMVEGDNDQVEFSYKSQSYRVKTIISYIKDHAQREKFLEFRKRWLNAYENNMLKRSKFDFIDKNNQIKNLYLQYRASKFCYSYEAPFSHQ